MKYELHQGYHLSLMIFCSERDMAQWLERGALPISLPAVRFRIPLGAEFSEKYHVSPLSILGNCYDVVSSGENDTISSMCRVGCRTVCSPWSWNGTRMSRSSDVQSDDRFSDLISDYSPAPLPLPLEDPKSCINNFCLLFHPDQLLYLNIQFM